jgi:hypothetical protein
LTVHTRWLKELKKNTEETLVQILASQNTPRADYREIAELTVIVLGGIPPRGIHWSRPGAIHQARWMARNIYSMKMFMFAGHLEYSVQTQSKLARMNTFLALFYTPRWMSAASAADAPVHDLSLIQDMLRYKETDPELANAVLKKMDNHMWYLTQEMVPFVLFSSNVSNSLKQDIANQLHRTERPESFRRGKPPFPKITGKTTLMELIGPESHFLFEVLGIDTKRQADPAESWQDNNDFRVARDYVISLKVVNDIAERGVKMMTDFAEVLTKDCKQREYLLQAVEYNRERFNSFKKATLNK